MYNYPSYAYICVMFNDIKNHHGSLITSIVLCSQCNQRVLRVIVYSRHAQVKHLHYIWKGVYLHSNCLFIFYFYFYQALFLFAAILEEVNLKGIFL